MSGSISLHFHALWNSNRASAQALKHSPRARRVALGLAVLVLVYGLFGFFAASPLLRNYLQSHSVAMLGRQLSLGRVRFNPFTLNLRVEKLHLSDPDGHAPFVDIDQLIVNASWSSLFRLAPVLDELKLDGPRIAITRGTNRRFNFSDLIDRFTSKPSPPGSKPARFALSNIRIRNGTIRFDDRALGSQHHIEHLDVGIPFLANLPSDTDIFVQPLLAMTVDGSALRINGQAKPFASNRESTIDFQLDRLELPRYLGYVPTPTLIAIRKGLLSGKLILRFVQTQPIPQLQLGGNLQLDDLILGSNHGETIASLGHGTFELADVQPLASRYHFGAVALERAAGFYTRHAGGRSNFDTLAAGQAPAATGDKVPPTDLRITSLTLQDSELSYVDTNQATLHLTRMHGNLLGLDTLAAPAAKLDLTAQLAGGDITAHGSVNLATSHYAGALDLKRVALAPLQALATSATSFGAARIGRGRLDASCQLRLDWGKTINLHIEPAQLAIDDFALEPQLNGHAAPVAWRKLDADISRLDLAGHEAQLGKVTVNGLQIDAMRERDHRINLVDLFASKPAATASHDANPAWHWSIAQLDIDKGTLRLTDQAPGDKPSQLVVDSIEGSVEGLSDRLNQPRQIKLEGSVGKGSFTATGKLQPLPTMAELQLTTRQLDIVGFVPYASAPLNVRVTSARLSSDGKLHYDGRTSQPRFDYRGNASFERVHVQDKLTGDDFVRWRSLAGSNIDLRYGSGKPRVYLGGMVLNAFYARVIISSNGRLNLSDVVASEAQAPVSVTRTETNAPAAPKLQTPGKPIGPVADIHIGGITLINGQLNFTDNFIKPNYTANLTRLTGKIGAFGTVAGSPPADLAAQAQLDDASPVDISGSINPLVPVAFLDIKGKATDVELTRLSAYSGKYTGYPVTGGKLTADVHYLLDQGKLSADNHIFITQLTFGDRMDSPGTFHLPVKLAVALLKDTEGNIDVNVPVSGSLDDPQFSLGGMIMRAFGNLIAKAATAPFRLLASAFGGGHEDLGYVEFAPGSAVLDGLARDRLEQLVKILGRRPTLTLDISGRVDLSLDEAGLRKVTVDDQVRREKLADESGDKVAADAPAAALAEVTVTPDEYEHYLRRAYKHAAFEKPKNVIGLSKSLEPDEMRSLLETHVSVAVATMRALAERRATAVQDWLHGKLDDKRVSIKAPTLSADGIDDKGKSTRADFGLH